MNNFKVFSKRKGFTIVELVIVIAVIAILATVLIPTLSSVVDEAKISVVSQLAANFNKAVVGREAVEKPIETMYDVMCALDDYGFEEVYEAQEGATIATNCGKKTLLI